MKIQKLSLTKYLLLTTFFFAANTNVQAATADAHNIIRLYYEQSPQGIYMKKYGTVGDPNLSYTYIDTVKSDQYLLFKKEGKENKTKKWENAIAFKFAPDGKGIFVLSKRSGGNYQLKHYNEYKPFDKNSIKVTVNDDKKKKTIINNAPSIISMPDIISMPEFSEDHKHGFIYVQNELNGFFTHISLKSGTDDAEELYETTLSLTNEKYYESLDCGEFKTNQHPQIYGAISNDAKFVGITRYQDSTQPIKLICGDWTSGQLNKEQISKNIKQDWLKKVVNLEYDEENKKFQFWTLERQEENKKVTFGLLNIYEMDWGSLKKGELPTDLPLPKESISLNFNKNPLTYKVFHIKRSSQGWLEDKYQYSYTIKKYNYDNNGNDIELERAAEISKIHPFLPICIIACFIALGLYLKSLLDEDSKDIDRLLAEGAKHNPHVRTKGASHSKKRKIDQDDDDDFD